MDANYLQARAASSAANSNSLNWFSERSAPKYKCTVNKYGQRKCVKQTSFFHRVGKFILIAVLIFFFLVTVLCICCCLKMRKKKSTGGSPKSGILGMFGKGKKQDQQYHLETAQPNGFYGQPPLPPQAHLAGQQAGYMRP